MSDQQAQPMEEILASIRRIIAEDKPIAPPPAQATGEADDVLELGEAPIEPAPAYFPPPPAEPVSAPSAGLLSGESAEASRRALASLAGLRLDRDAPENTLDGVVTAMLRPMLKEWLDANLPELIERIVAREIARLGAR